MANVTFDKEVGPLVRVRINEVPHSFLLCGGDDHWRWHPHLVGGHSIGRWASLPGARRAVRAFVESWEGKP